MTKLRKKAILYLVLCLVALVASIVFSVVLLGGNDEKPASSAGTTVQNPNPPPAASTAPDAAAEPTAEPTAEPIPEATPMPVFDGLEKQPDVIYAEDQRPSFTVDADTGLRMRGGPGTDYEKVSLVADGTKVTALGANSEDTWVMVQANGVFGWLSKEYLTAA